MKNVWPVKSIEEVCVLRPPKAEARKRLASNAEVSFLPMEDLGIDAKNPVPTKTRPLAEVVGSYTYFADGDVLLAKITPCFQNGKLGIAGGLRNGVGFGSSEFFVLRPSLQLDKEYLYYFLSRDDFRQEGVLRMGGSVGQQRVPPEFLVSQRIPLPPLAEQRRIVGILDEAFDGIATAKANAEINLQNAHYLFESALSRAIIGEATKEWREGRHSNPASGVRDFDSIFHRIDGGRQRVGRSEKTTGHEAVTKLLPSQWQVASIGSLFKLIDYRGKNPPRSNSGRRLITAKNIRMGYVSEHPITFISEETYRKWMVRGFPKIGDILFVTEGHTMGFVALNTRTDDFALAQRTITLQPAADFEARFFFYFMMSFYFQDLIKLNATGSAAVGMKASKLRSLPLPFPSLAEQLVIVNKLDDLWTDTQRLASLYQQKLAALDALKKSLLHQAFSGKL